MNLKSSESGTYVVKNEYIPPATVNTNNIFMILHSSASAVYRTIKFYEPIKMHRSEKIGVWYGFNMNFLKFSGLTLAK